MTDSRRKGVSLLPSDAYDDRSPLLKLIQDTQAKQIFPQVAERDIRKHLRLSHGDTIEILPTAIERVQAGYGLHSFTEATQWLSLSVDKLISENPVSVSCMDAYARAQDRAEDSRILRSIIDKGSGFSITNKSQRGTTIYAFNYNTANSIEKKSASLGMPAAHVAQIFSCLALSGCSDCLKKDTIDILLEEAMEGLKMIEYFDYCLRFESKIGINGVP